MIITNNSNESHTKSAPPSPALLPSAGSSSLPPPPAYSRRYPQPTTPVLPREAPQMPFLYSGIKQTEPAGKRFFKAFGVAAVLYVILMVLTHNVVASTMTQSFGPPAGPRPSDGNATKCFPDSSQSQPSQIVMSGLPYEYSFTYTVPASSNLVYFLSRGSYGHGTLRFELAEDPGDDIEVRINVWCQYQNILQHIRVCLLERNNQEHGVGFFTPGEPGWPWPGNTVQFDVTVRFPRSRSNSPLEIKALETHMGIWKHEFDSLQGQVNFQSLSLSATNAGIDAGSVSATTGKVATTNSPIEGSFNVTDNLVLRTSNSHIKIDIRMQNADGHKPTSVDLRTSNGYISAPITLVSTSSNASYPSAFSVSAVTSNSPLSLSFPDAPTLLPFTKLDLVAKTSNSPINVALHSTYEGTVSQRASIFTPKLEAQTSTRDPSGGDRTRAISRQLLGHLLTSRVWWGDNQNKENMGNAVVTTSNSPNVVMLG